MNTLLSPKPAVAYEARRVERPETNPIPVTAPAAAPGPLASFIRFAVLGGGVGVLSSGAVAALAGVMPWVVANALITVASTLLCTELHARFTFGAGGRAGWRRHWQSAGSAAAAYAVTCAAMFVLHLVQQSPGMPAEQIVYLGASGLAGIARFLVLRLFVFATGRDRSAAPESPARVRETGGAGPATATPAGAPSSARRPRMSLERRTRLEKPARRTTRARRAAAGYGRLRVAQNWTVSPATWT
ncbi:GtrA family protein [Streptomyces sp. NPDC087903]|uniref:GtrA family protein n=1 Tax=Streptomyces sp. NPDC087903 TaxID=3365819 RepID=UPI00380E73A8